MTWTAAHTITIRRRNKLEALQAIKDLKRRGYEVIAPLTNIQSDGKDFRPDEARRRVFMNNTFSTCWMARLRRESK